MHGIEGGIGGGERGASWWTVTLVRTNFASGLSLHIAYHGALPSGGEDEYAEVQLVEGQGG